MKELRGKASAKVLAPLEASFALLHAIERYPSWNRDLFREVEVLERDDSGAPARAWANLRVARGRFVKDFELVVAVRAERPNAVYVERIPNEPSDEERLKLTWALHEEGQTRVALSFAAALSSLPSFLPLRGVGDQIAGSLVKAVARALA